MSKGWGYGRRKGQGEKIVDRLSIKCDNEKYKVYESLDNLYYGGKLSIRILFDKEKNTIKVVLTGLDFTGEKIKPLTKVVTEFKTLDNIRNELLNNILYEFDNIRNCRSC